MRARFLYLLVPLAATQLGATDCGGITRDPGFDLWCGEELCAWKTVRGEIRRAPTWHAEDAGVELVGPDTAISQLTPVTSGDTGCIRFDLIANVNENAEVMLLVDVFGDGQIEREERIPTARWQPISFKLPIDAPYGGIRFEIAKRGTGTAVIAQVHAETAVGECEGLVAPANQPAPMGSPCEVDADCASEMCRTVPTPATWFRMNKLCAGCDPAAPSCGAGEVCGFGEALSSVQFIPTTCVPEAERELGEECITNAECVTGICNDYVCSTCSDQQPCAAGGACGDGYGDERRTPSICSPGAGTMQSGSPCTSNADCSSGLCNGGERKQCSDGRPCSSPLQCPSDGVENGACEVVGIQGGRCQ